MIKLEEFWNNYTLYKCWKIYSHKSDIFMKTFINHHWYVCVNLSHEWKSKNIKVHILVAKKYLKKVRWKRFVNHKDWNKLNCHKDNLEYSTRSENMIHVYQNWLRKNMSTKWIVILQMKDWAIINEFASVLQASKQLCIWYSCIRSCIYWLQKTSRWFTFVIKN